MGQRSQPTKRANHIAGYGLIDRNVDSVNASGLSQSLWSGDSVLSALLPESEYLVSHNSNGNYNSPASLGTDNDSDSTGWFCKSDGSEGIHTEPLVVGAGEGESEDNEPISRPTAPPVPTFALPPSELRAHNGPVDSYQPAPPHRMLSRESVHNS